MICVPSGPTPPRDEPTLPPALGGGGTTWVPKVPTPPLDDELPPPTAFGGGGTTCALASVPTPPRESELALPAELGGGGTGFERMLPVAEPPQLLKHRAGAPKPMVEQHLLSVSASIANWPGHAAHPSAPELRRSDSSCPRCASCRGRHRERARRRSRLTLACFAKSYAKLRARAPRSSSVLHRAGESPWNSHPGKAQRRLFAGPASCDSS